MSSILDLSDGVTLTSTGLILIREHYDFASKVIDGSKKGDERAFRFLYTLNHEAVHFYQSFTATMPYAYSRNLVETSIALMKESREGRLDAPRLREFRQAFARYTAQFQSPHRGVSTLDLLEAMAVTEGFRATVGPRENGGPAFTAFLHREFPVADSPYRRVLDIVAKEFGPDAAYDLTPKLCFLALNGDHPAANFWTMLDRLAGEQIIKLGLLRAKCTIHVGELCETFGMDPKGSLLALSHAVPEAYTHPIFIPYMQALAKIGTLEDRFEFAAQPGNWIAGAGPSEFNELMPPLIILSGNRGMTNGLAKHWSKDELFQYADATAQIGAGLVLMTEKRPYQACQHSACPAHASALCHQWFAKPHDVPWQDCAFPERFKTQFGVGIEALPPFMLPARA